MTRKTIYSFVARRAPEGSWEVHKSVINELGGSASIIMRGMKEEDAKEYARLSDIAWNKPDYLPLPPKEDGE